MTKELNFSVTPTLSTEMRRLFRLFWPIVLGQLAQTSMGVVDTVMAGAAGTVELSGVAIGGSFFWPPLLFLIGLSVAISPIVANLRGASKAHDIPENIHVASVVCLGFSILVAILMCFLPKLYHLIEVPNPHMIEVATNYLYAVALGIPGFTLFNILRSYWEGLGNTLPTLIFGFTALILNIPLNYIFIFGKFGAPALGGAGCGVATTLTIYITVVLMLIYVQKHPFFAQYRIFRKTYPLKKEALISYLKLALPLGLSTTIEVTCFSLVSFLLSPFGPATVAAHSIALNVSGLLFICPLSLASAATIRTGEAMGARSWERALRTTQGVIALGLIFYVISFLLVILNRELIISLYSNDEAVRIIALTLLTTCACYLLPDSTQVLSIGILRGFKDSKTIFIVTVLAYWVIGMPLGVTLAYGFITEKLAALGFWFGFCAALSVAALIYVIRIYRLFKTRKLPKALMDHQEILDEALKA